MTEDSEEQEVQESSQEDEKGFLQERVPEEAVDRTYVEMGKGVE